MSGGSGPSGRSARRVDVVVVGAGPAGLAVGTALARIGAGTVEVLDREPEAGGVPRHCLHTGFGLRDLRTALDGPAYARRRVDLAVAAGATVRTGVSVTGWAGGGDDGDGGGGAAAPSRLMLETTSRDGLERLDAAVVVLATGARERPRPARWIPGDRPDGVLTTGQLQRLVVAGLPVGRRAVVVGAEHVSYSAVVTLAHAGVEVAAMVTPLPAQVSYPLFRAATSVRYRVPLVTGATVARVIGRGRLRAVEVRRADGTTEQIACDTLVLTGDWVADHELARLGGASVDPASTGVLVDTAGRTSVPGLLAAGNVVHPGLTADLAARSAESVVAAALATLTGRARPQPTVGFVLGEPLAWVAPGLVPADRAPAPDGHLVLGARELVRRPVVEVRQGPRLLWSGRSPWTLGPGRPLRIPARWVVDVRVPGREVAITLH